MKKLKDMNMDEIQDWIKARKEMGDEEYGDDHMERYCLVDVVEELIDALIILDKWNDKNARLWSSNSISGNEMNNLNKRHSILKEEIWNIIKQIPVYDEHETDRGRVDENADDRVYFDK